MIHLWNIHPKRTSLQRPWAEVKVNIRTIQDNHLKNHFYVNFVYFLQTFNLKGVKLYQWIDHNPQAKDGKLISVTKGQISVGDCRKSHSYAWIIVNYSCAGCMDGSFKFHRGLWVIIDVADVDLTRKYKASVRRLWLFICSWKVFSCLLRLQISWS